jgi:anti-sigma B factor antagonist
MVIIEKEDNIDVVRFNTDRINALNVDEVKSSIATIFETQHTKTIIDLSGVNYIDSTGFAMFLHLLRLARSNYCSFKLCGLTPAVMSLFIALQLNSTFEIFPDKDSCIKSY